MRRCAGGGRSSVKPSPISSASELLRGATNGIWMKSSSRSPESHTGWLWRAVDQNGFVLDVLIQRRRDSRAAQRLMRRLLKSAVTPPRVMVTDKLRSYGAARAKMGLRVEHRQHKGLNNRAENSHQPTRRRERIMKRFKSTRQAQRFLAIHDQVANLFHIPYPESATADFRRASRERAFAAWREISKTGATA
jgi:putative transposase